MPFLVGCYGLMLRDLSAMAIVSSSAEPAVTQSTIMNRTLMRHFIQYHNTDVRGQYKRGKRFGIVTNKPVENLLQDRVWLVAGTDTPRRYFLCETFVVEEVDRNPPFNYSATAREGMAFEPPVSIDGLPWFEDMRRATGNFAFGLQRIKSQRIIRGLQKLIERPVGKSGLAASKKRGGGFGDYEQNRLVEQAAIRAVRNEYRSYGWSVVSREHLCLGYDLCCSLGKQQEHVEVKGIRGELCSFVITANETEAARIDP